MKAPAEINNVDNVATSPWRLCFGHMDTEPASVWEGHREHRGALKPLKQQKVSESHRQLFCFRQKPVTYNSIIPLVPWTEPLENRVFIDSWLRSHSSWQGRHSKQITFHHTSPLCSQVRRIWALIMHGVFYLYCCYGLSSAASKRLFSQTRKWMLITWSVCKRLTVTN